MQLKELGLGEKLLLATAESTTGQRCAIRNYFFSPSGRKWRNGSLTRAFYKKSPNLKSGN